MADPAPTSFSKRLTIDALLTALALAIYFLEAQLPPPVPVPGVKLGLSHIVILFALWRFGVKDGAVILLCRILLASIFGGQLMAFLFSLCGGILSFLAMLAVKPLLNQKQIWVCGVISALGHGLGQVLAAWLVLKRAEVFTYLPILIISGILTGLATGLLAQELIRRVK